MSLKLSDEQSALISTYKDVITLIIEKCGDSVISKYETLYDGIPSEAEIMSKVSNEEYDRIKKFLELDWLGLTEEQDFEEPDEELRELYKSSGFSPKIRCLKSNAKELFIDLCNNNVKFTSEQAINELKKWKDKLDLELISQEEYDKKKNELSQFIN